MSEIIDALKDVVNPARREQATTETYDPHTRGPYADRKPEDGKPEVAPPANAEAQDPKRAECTNLNLSQTAGDTLKSGSNLQSNK